MAEGSAERLARLIPPRALILAPMAGITEAPFRAICKRMGADFTYTEMVSATGLHFHFESRTAQALLTMAPEEVPAGVQLFGGDPVMMAEQAARLVSELGERLALVDINMGCPVAKVVSKGEGAGLMRTPERASSIVSAVVEAVAPVPVTVKFRAGWDRTSINAPEFARAMEAAGASAVAVHGRTRAEFYRGEADWSVIADVKGAVSVPVFGSGDVLSGPDAVRMFDETDVDGVMIARGVQGNPWIFAEARALLDGVEPPPPPTASERVAMAREHAAALVEYFGERAFVRMRKHVAWYVHGMPDAARVREAVNGCRSYAELDEMLAEYAGRLKEE